MSLSTHADSIDWPEFVPVPTEKVLAGQPATATVELRSDAHAQYGFWRSTPGEYTSVRAGFEEFVYILSGEGEVVGDDGVAFPLTPGAVVYLADGWSGRWVIRETVTKVYSIVHTV